ncbi:MAG: PfkB family carbohydrate kinase [Pseudomonadota bacterium]
MTAPRIHVFGSINIDYVYRVPHAPAAGETLSDTGREVHLGGKGANQALAAARAGAEVRLAGAVGADGAWTLQRLAAGGVDVTGVVEIDAATGHAVILVEPDGENRIILHGGANRALPESVLDKALATAQSGDWWLTQNETARVRDSMAAAQAQGLVTAHAAAPFVPADAETVLPHADLLAVNAVEEAALVKHLGGAVAVPRLLVTRGAEGAQWRETTDVGPKPISVPAFPVTPIDTTGAGDCFLGYMLAGLALGQDAATALRRAAAAAAIAVTRPGAADAIPDAAEVDAFLREATKP